MLGTVPEREPVTSRKNNSEDRHPNSTGTEPTSPTSIIVMALSWDPAPHVTPSQLQGSEEWPPSVEHDHIE